MKEGGGGPWIFSPTGYCGGKDGRSGAETGSGRSKEEQGSGGGGGMKV